MTRHPLLVLVVPIVLSLATIPVARQVTDDLSTGGWLPSQSESAQVDRFLATEFGRRTTSHYLVFSDPTGTLAATDPQFRREVERVVGPLRSSPDVSGVYTWGTTSNRVLDQLLLSDDAGMSMVIVTLREGVPAATERFSTFRTSLQSDLLRIEIGGWPATAHDFRDVTRSDLARAEVISLPATAILLVLIFGGIVVAGMPILLAALSLIPTFAIIALLSRVMETSIFSVNAVSMIGLAVGIDYALMLITRYREERAVAAPDDALVRTLDTAGRAIIVSGAAVAIGLLGLILFAVPAAVSTELAGATIVLVSVVLSLSSLPAALLLLGERIAAPETRWNRRHPFSRAFQIMRRHLDRHPGPALLVATIVLVTLALPVLDLRLSAPDMRILPADRDARQAYETIDSEFSDATLSPVMIVVEPRFGEMSNPRNLNRLRDLAARLEGVDGVRSVDSIWSFLPVSPGSSVFSGGLMLDGIVRETAVPYLTDRAALVQITAVGDASDEAAMDLVDWIRTHEPQLTGGDLTLRVGGEAASNLDLIRHVESRSLASIGVVVVTTLVVLFAQFRSILLPVKAVLLNLLSLSASFGALVWIFQQGHLAGLLGFEPLEYTVVVVPILMFCFMFGLSMDYEVIMLARIREVWLETGDNDRAVTGGLAASARIVTSAAAAMLVVFVAFGASELQVIKAIGVGLAIAIVIDATLIRLVMLPAAMQLMGRWNWWVPSIRLAALRPGVSTPTTRES